MTTLKRGDKAPNFVGLDQNGEQVSLSDFKGKKLILYFYPKDNTPGCTAEACSLRDANVDLMRMGFSIVGVSRDTVSSHKKFSDKLALNFPIIADTDMKIIRDYDVFGEKKFMGVISQGIIRTTFVISEDGIIEHVITNVKTKEHADQILEMYE